MIISKSEFIISAVKREQYPTDGRNEVAFVGRSNVGKSSIINALTNRRKLAKVSQTPGKTRLINFFLINDGFYLVDLPGYGYAKVSKTEKASWGKTIEMYLTDREELKYYYSRADLFLFPSVYDASSIVQIEAASQSTPSLLLKNTLTNI